MSSRGSRFSRSLFGARILSEGEKEELHKLGIRSRYALVSEIQDARDARRLADESGISAQRMLDLWRLAELRQVHGIGDASALLLLHSGVRSVADLGRRNPNRLYDHLVEVNEDQKWLDMPPRQQDVLHWIRRARRLTELDQER